jgi:hypothetical protein
MSDRFNASVKIRLANASFADEWLSGSVAGFRALYRDRGAWGGGSVDRGDLARRQRDIGRTTDPVDADVEALGT